MSTREKRLTRLRDDIASESRALPWAESLPMTGSVDELFDTSKTKCCD